MRRQVMLLCAGCALAACTTQRLAEVLDDPEPVGVTSCQGVAPTGVDAVWSRYLQKAPTSGMGGCAFSTCHGGPTGGGGMRFSSPAEFVAATVNIKSTDNPAMMRVKMKDPAASYLYQRLLPEAGPDRMPPNGPYLDQQALDELAGWICSGDSPSAPR